MDYALRWYRQFQHLVHEAMKFGAVGVVGLVITNGGYYLMHNRMGVGPVTSTTIATIIATVFAYVGNRYWSFQHRERTGVAREGVIFVVLNGIGLAIQSGVVGFNYYVLGFQHGHKVEQFLALNFGIAIATVFRFWSYRKWVWADPVASGTDSGAAAAGQPGGPGSTPAQPESSRQPAGHPGAGQSLPQSPVAGQVPVNGREQVNGSRPAVRVNGHIHWEPSPQPGRSTLDG